MIDMRDTPYIASSSVLVSAKPSPWPHSHALCDIYNIIDISVFKKEPKVNTYILIQLGTTLNLEILMIDELLESEILLTAVFWLCLSSKMPLFRDYRLRTPKQMV